MDPIAFTFATAADELSVEAALSDAVALVLCREVDEALVVVLLVVASKPVSEAVLSVADVKALAVPLTLVAAPLGALVAVTEGLPAPVRDVLSCAGPTLLETNPVTLPAALVSA